jgi:hypothetical protein
MIEEGGRKGGTSSSDRLSDLAWAASKEGMSLLGRPTVGLVLSQSHPDAICAVQLSRHQRTLANINLQRWRDHSQVWTTMTMIGNHLLLER